MFYISRDQFRNRIDYCIIKNIFNRILFKISEIYILHKKKYLQILIYSNYSYIKNYKI